jgi:cation diffusion facilitator CzcD-associated flavoprotein CzcO
VNDRNGTASLPERTLDIVVIGAGFAGMHALHRFRDGGFDTLSIEAGPDVGGVWFWNRYPGARCDIPSLDYSFAFSDELYDEWNWSERYATQPEILTYARFVADRLDLRRDIRFETRVNSARFDEAAGLWRLDTTRGAVSTQNLVLATGQVSVPNMPHIPNIETFEGDVYRTWEWPEQPVDFTGKRVGMIGTGSTGIQVLPQVAAQAAHVTVFQRTPTFAVPMVNYPYSADGEDIVVHKQEARAARKLAVKSRFGNTATVASGSVLTADVEERLARFEEAWNSGRTAGILLAYDDILRDLEANEVAKGYLHSKIREIVKDPVTAEMLCPTGYPVGAKRPSLEQGFYDAFNLDHVTLVDVRDEPIRDAGPLGLRTDRAQYDIDALIFATGFDTLTGAILRIDIEGRDGVTMKEKWAHGPQTYLGIGISGFPNLFLVAGPGSPSLLSNVIISIEHHVEWIADLLTRARAEGSRIVEATPEAETQWQEHAAAVAEETLYPHSDSAYTGANIPGKPRALLPYVGGVGLYQEMCREVAEDDFRGFRRV